MKMAAVLPFRVAKFATGDVYHHIDAGNKIEAGNYQFKPKTYVAPICA